MLSGNDFEAKYKVNEDGTMVMQLALKPISGQFTPSPELSEENAVLSIKDQMGSALSNMIFGDAIRSLYEMCSKSVGQTIEGDLCKLINQLSIDLTDMDVKMVEVENGKEKSQEKS